MTVAPEDGYRYSCHLLEQIDSCQMATYKIRQKDAFRSVSHMRESSVHLVVTSPPYNLGKSYERRTELDKYLQPYEKFIQHLHRVLTNEGSVCWQVGNYVADGNVIPLDVVFFPIFERAGFVLKNRIVWHFRHGLHANKRFSGRYETILWFSKSDSPTFNLDPVRVPSLYPGKRGFKGPRKGRLTGNPAGKNPSDVWADVVLDDWESCFWDFPNVKSNHPEKTVHPCQYPVELAERCVLALSNEGDIVLDPFLGVGTTAIAAIRHNRNFVGYELDRTFVKEARSRVQLERRGKLATRTIGTPIPRPSGKVAQRQLE